MELSALFSSPMFWVITGLLLFASGVLFKLSRFLSRTVAKGGLIGIVVIGVVAYYFLGGSLGGLQAVSTENVGEITVTLAGGNVNTSTTDDYYNDAKDIVTLYVQDADITDDGNINVTATIERTSVEKAATIPVTCTSNDVPISGITSDNIVSKTSGDIDMTVGGSSKHLSPTSVTFSSAYAEGDNTNDVVVQFQHDETYQDGMTEKDTVSIDCVAGNKPFHMVIVADN